MLIRGETGTRQGAARSGHPRHERPKPRSVHPDQLRGDPRDAARGGALRGGGGGLHRCAAAESGALPDRAPRHAVPRRSRALAHELQAKLLTAIEDGRCAASGGVRGEAVDVWVLSATSADLEAAMAAERLPPGPLSPARHISLWLPPLRERGGDVLQLAGEFLARACGDYGRPQKTLTPEAQAAIAGYRWPGNVRELANVMERVALMTDASLIESGRPRAAGLTRTAAAANGDTPAAISGFTDSLYRFERAQLIAALDATGWNVVQAAQHLGIPRTTLRHRMTKYRLARGGVTLLLPQPPRHPRGRKAAVTPGGWSFGRSGRSRSCRRASRASRRRRWRSSSKRSRGSAASSWRSPPPASWPPSESRRRGRPEPRRARRTRRAECLLAGRSGIAHHGRPLPSAA